MTNYNPNAKATTNARRIRLRNAHQALCSFHDMCSDRNAFKNARRAADEAILAIERCAYHSGIPVADVTEAARIDANLKS